MVWAADSVRLYHVSPVRPETRQLTPNQVLSAGVTASPYFARRYERALQYPVNQNGQIVQMTAVRWLTAVRDEILTPEPDIHPKIALDVVWHYLMLSRELVLEEIRTTEFGGLPPSRQSCIYACDTLESAQQWQSVLAKDATICELECTGTMHRADASLLLADSESLSATKERARAYWRGDMGANARPEVLFSGKARVTRIDLSAG